MLVLASKMAEHHQAAAALSEFADVDVFDSMEQAMTALA